jgi:hypothetical protein
MIASRYIVYFIVGTIPILFAAVQPWIWSFYTACIFASFFVLPLQHRDSGGWIPGKLFIILIGIFLGIAFIQCLPLPSSALSFLSPFRLKILSQASTMLESPNEWNTLSYASRTSFAWWIFLLSLVFFFFSFTKCFASYRNLKLLIYILLIVATLEASTMGVLWVEKTFGSARGTYINRNHFAGFIEMILPLGLGYTLSLGNWKEKISLKTLMSTDRPNFQFFITIGLAVMVLALVFSKSRAGITGGVLGFLLFAILLHTGSKGLPRSYWVITGIIWRDSMVIVKEHPFGTGLATFKQVFPVFNVSTVAETTPYYAHNDYLQLLVETGWIGFLALVSGFYIFLFRSFRKVKQMRLQDDPLRFFLAIGALSGLVSIPFHSFFDFNLQIPANCVYFVMLLGIVDVTLWQDRSLIDRK